MVSVPQIYLNIWEKYRKRITQSDEELSAPNDSQSCTQVNTVTDVVAA